MDDWKDKVIELIEKVLKHGWGGVRVTISAKGKRITYRFWLDEISEQK